MAKALYLVSRSTAVGQRSVDAVNHVLINKDDTSTNAQIIAEAVVKANAAFGLTNGEFDANYFDTVEKVSDLTTGPLAADTAAYVFTDAEKVLA